MHYVKRSEPTLWTVGIGEGQDWHPISDHGNPVEAQEEANRLNGAAPRNTGQDEALRHAHTALQCATLDKARLQEALDRVTAMVRDESPALFKRIAEGILSDYEQSTEAWLVQHIEPANPLHENARIQAA